MFYGVRASLRRATVLAVMLIVPALCPGLDRPAAAPVLDPSSPPSSPPISVRAVGSGTTASTTVASSGVPDAFDLAVKVAPIVTAVCAVAGFLLAYFTLKRVHLAKKRSDWFDAFGALHQEFWHNDETAEVRRWLVSDQAYEALRRVLVRRNAHADNRVDAYDNALLEKVDRFCALMVRINTLGTLGMDRDQHELWFHLYGRFWLGKLHKRLELQRYIDAHWPVLSDSAASVMSMRRGRVEHGSSAPASAKRD